MRALSVWLANILVGRTARSRGMRIRVWHVIVLWLLLSGLGWHVLAVALMQVF